MDPVLNIHQSQWQELTDLKGARGYEFIPLVADDPGYTTAYSCEMVRLGPTDYSVPHTEPWNHLLYCIEGAGELTIGDRTWPVTAGTSAKVKAGQRHSLRNHGPGEMLVMAIYDPPRVRKA